MSSRTYYQILGITRTEGSPGVRRAFRELARRYHPDRAGPRGTPFFRQIVEAYEVLSDPSQRASYDRGLTDAGDSAPPRPATVPPTGPGPEPLVPEPLVPDAASRMHDFVTHGPMVNDIFERVSRSFTDQWHPKSQQLDAVDVRLDLDADEAVRGGTVAFAVPVFYPCPACHGSGRQWRDACRACGDSGVHGEEQLVRLTIPAGVRDGTLLSLPLRGLGLHSLYLRVLIRVGWRS